MEAIVSALREEKKQADRLLKLYLKELKALPKGSFFTRKRGEKVYCYLTYSIAGEIRQSYLGRLDKDKIKEYRAAMQRKKSSKSLFKRPIDRNPFYKNP